MRREKPWERGWGSLWTVCKQNGGRHVVFQRRRNRNPPPPPEKKTVETV